MLCEITNARLWVFCKRTSGGFGASLVVFEVLPDAWLVKAIWVAVKIMIPFWVPSILGAVLE